MRTRASRAAASASQQRGPNSRPSAGKIASTPSPMNFKTSPPFSSIGPTKRVEELVQRLEDRLESVAHRSSA